jgi:tRNA dimethylallyltransferase
MSEKTKYLVLVAGPTAVGKTKLAIRLAEWLQTEIISADSRQCYQELNIGVARPSSAELAQIPHHFIASHSIHQPLSAAAYAEQALAIADRIFQQHHHVVLTGGTGLYIRALCDGLDEIPDIAPDIRQKILERYEAGGMSWLQQEIAQKDPVYFQQGEIHNPRRLLRALEVLESTGESILHFQKGKSQERPFTIIRIGLELPRTELYARINARVLQMMKEGLEEEARSLYPFRHLQALQTVGYAELFDYFDGKYDLSRAVELIQQHTRHYAKRQLTWFKKDIAMQWFHPDSWEQMREYVSTHSTASPANC